MGQVWSSRVVDVMERICRAVAAAAVKTPRVEQRPRLPESCSTPDWLHPSVPVRGKVRLGHDQPSALRRLRQIDGGSVERL
jgi:hypothetical protein